MGTAETLPFVRSANCRIADFFSPNHIAMLERLMRTRHAPPGSFLYREGGRADNVYYVRSGRVAVTQSTPDGKELILLLPQAGDLFGEIVCLRPAFHSSSARAIQPAELGVIALDDLEALMAQNGAFALEFVRWMALVQRTTQSKFRDLLLYGKPGALASTLIRLCNTCGVACERGILIPPALNHTELAQMIGTTRESVNRMLGSFKSQGILSVERGKLVIHDLDRLRRICRCPENPACPAEICRI